MPILIAAAMLGFQGSAARYNPTGPKIVVTMKSGKSFTITTDPKNYPGTVSGISKLVKSGFYDGTRFHRVEDWVVQWGDPYSKAGVDAPGVGTGGSGHPLKFEGGVVPFIRGVVGIASKGSSTGGDGQLFAVRKDAEWLYNQYAILGKVTAGMDVIDGITRGDQVTKMTIVGASAARK